jgi:hypothetical protein
MIETKLRSIPALGGIAALVAATACSAPGETPPPPSNDGAAARFWTAFHQGDHASIEEVRRALDEELADSPGAYTTFLRAHVDLWELVEVVGRGDDQGAKAKLALAALDNFELAMDDNPDDLRLHAWHGMLVTGVAAAVGDETMYQAGLDEIEIAATSGLPSPVGGFTRMSVLARNSPSDPRFEAGVEATWAMAELCVGGPVDRENPGVTGLPIASVGCQNFGVTPHSWEGFWLNAGDVLAKAGAGSVAETLYQNAKLSEGFATWRYAAELEQRLAELDARIAAYQDADPANHPPLGTSNFCHGCHTN